MTAGKAPLDRDTKGEKRLIGRRQLLKALIAAGGAATGAALLPDKWHEPHVEVGVLPAHAQASALPTTTPAPTATPRPLALITTCSARNAGGGVVIGPTDTIETYALIEPAISVELRRTITLNEPGHPHDGVVDVYTGQTTPIDGTSARFDAPDFDLSTLSSPDISIGVERLTIVWDFVNIDEGTGSCSRFIDIE